MSLNDTVEKNTNKLMALNETVVDQEGQMEQITTYFLSIQVRNHISKRGFVVLSIKKGPLKLHLLQKKLCRLLL